MRKTIALAAILCGAASMLALPVQAGGDLSEQDPVTVRIDLGKDGVDAHRYHPDKLTFETGKLYKLVIHNPSNSKHYFTSLAFASKVWTRKVQVMDDLGPGAKAIAEIKGAVREIEVLPGGTTEWWLVPVATGTITDLHCSVKYKDGKTHGEKGMKGTIIIM
ncbi:MAG: biphenyl 2,3-dioxygenase [Alphaproteobacteria bacterium]